MISEQLHKDVIRFKEWHEGRAAQAKNCATFNVTPALQEIAAGHEKVAATVAALLDALPQPAPSPQAPGRRKGPPGITLEPQGHEQPAVPVVSDEQILEAAREWSNSNFVAGSECFLLDFTRAILARRPVQVPMTDDGVDAKCLTIIGHLLSRRERDRIVWRMAEAHHGITAKSEGGA